MPLSFWVNLGKSIGINDLIPTDLLDPAPPRTVWSESLSMHNSPLKRGDKKHPRLAIAVASRAFFLFNRIQWDELNQFVDVHRIKRKFSF